MKLNVYNRLTLSPEQLYKSSSKPSNYGLPWLMSIRPTRHPRRKMQKRHLIFIKKSRDIASQDTFDLWSELISSKSHGELMDMDTIAKFNEKPN